VPMDDALTVQRLIEVGLSKYEALSYFALLGHEESSAVEVADRAGIPRQRVYDVLGSLQDKNMISVREGRPARHTARPPALALPGLLAARQREQAAENARLERLIRELVPNLEECAGGNGSGSLLEQIRRASEKTIGGF
jgi:sugar-specific transcriptional regulator TrmB